MFKILCEQQNTKFKKEPIATSSNIGHSVIGHWSLSQLGNKKHVANLAKLTKLANLTAYDQTTNHQSPASNL
jgi:hypothetical protein